jgi:hypothetical protein
MKLLLDTHSFLRIVVVFLICSLSAWAETGFGISGDTSVDTRSIGVGVSGDVTVDTRAPTKVTFEIWSADFPGVTSVLGNTDKDGLSNLMEYALDTNPLTASAGPASGIGNYTVAGVPGRYLVLTFTRRTNGSDITTEAQFSTTLPGTWLANGVLENSIANPDGSVTETWRSPSNLTAQPKQFGRVRAVKPWSGQSCETMRSQGRYCAASRGVPLLNVTRFHHLQRWRGCSGFRGQKRGKHVRCANP